MADGTAMYPNLVRPAREELDFEEREVAESLKHRISAHRLLATALIDGHAAVLCSAFSNRKAIFPCVVRHLTADERKIDFFDLMPRELQG